MNNYKYGSIIVLLLFFSCATTINVLDSPPEWVDSLPVSNDNIIYFYGISTKDSVEEARYQAAVDLAYNVLFSLGLTRDVINSLPDTSKTAIEEIKEIIIRQVLVSSLSGLNGFTVLEQSYYQESDIVVNYYILAAISAQGFTNLKRDISHVYWFDEPVVYEAEKKAAEKESQGDEWNAALLYIDAAYLGLEKGGVLSDVLFERNIDKAIELIDGFQFIGENPGKILIGFENSSPFVLRIINAENSSVNSKVLFTVSFQEKNREEKIITRTGRIVSEPDGRVVFRHPTPEFSGESFVALQLLVENIPDDYSDYPDYARRKFDKLKLVISEKKYIFNFVIETNPKVLSTGILILDTDILDKPLKNFTTETTVYNELKNSGYDVQIMELTPNILLNKTDQEIIRDLKTLYIGTYDRIIFGKASISEYKSSNDTATIEAAATIKVLDVKKGAIIYTQNYLKSASANDSQQAISAAFYLIGKGFASNYALFP